MKKTIKCVQFVVLLCLLDSAFAQQIEVQINGAVSKAYLSALSGEKTPLIDSIDSRDGIYNFVFDNNERHRGIYRISIIDKKYLDFICDGEDVEIKTDVNNILENLTVIKSESNKIYYKFVKLNKDYKTKTELLQLILARYPKEDEYYQTTKEKLIQVQEMYLYFINATAQANSNSFIARYVRSAQLPVVDGEIPFDKQLAYLKTHALDNVDFYDEGLIYADAFTNKTIEYLTYYRNPQLPLGLLEKEFMSAVDSILNKAKVNENVYKHIVGYLLDGFKKFGFDNVINYIVERYVIKDDLCLNQKLSDSIDRRIQQSRNFKTESTVPNIILPDSSGSLIDLQTLNKEKTLIIFYASWCPHCQTLIPQIYDKYKNQSDKKFEVLAVSMDTSRTDWLNFIRTKNLDWLNVSDLEGWDGKAAQDYNIYATPTMFLADKDKKLIKIVTSVEEIL